MRFTLGKLFLAVAMLALACAGMMYRDHFWASVVFSVTLAVYFWGAMIAMKSTGSKRAVAVWFVSAGAFYLVITTSPWFANYGQYVLTNYPIAWFARVYRIGYGDGYPLGNIVSTALQAPESNRKVTVLFFIGNCIWSWIFAVVAAWFAGRMYDRLERATKEAT